MSLPAKVLLNFLMSIISHFCILSLREDIFRYYECLCMRHVHQILRKFLHAPIHQTIFYIFFYIQEKTQKLCRVSNKLLTNNFRQFIELGRNPKSLSHNCRRRSARGSDNKNKFLRSLSIFLYRFVPFIAVRDSAKRLYNRRLPL